MIQALGTEGERNASTALCDAVALALHFVGDEVWNIMFCDPLFWS